MKIRLALMVILVMTAPVLADQNQEAYSACQRVMRSCISVAKLSRTGDDPKLCAPALIAHCDQIIRSWSTVQPAALPTLTSGAALACDKQTIANSLGDSDASKAAGVNCVW